MERTSVIQLNPAFSNTESPEKAESTNQETEAEIPLPSANQNPDTDSDEEIIDIDVDGNEDEDEVDLGTAAQRLQKIMQPRPPGKS